MKGSLKVDGVRERVRLKGNGLKNLKYFVKEKSLSLQDRESDVRYKNEWKGINKCGSH